MPGIGWIACGWARLWLVLAGLVLALAGASLVAGPAAAQEAVGAGHGRDCHVIRTCRFTRGGSYRGCLSSYSCRICQPVASRCTGADRAAGRRVCRELVCRWAG